MRKVLYLPLLLLLLVNTLHAQDQRNCASMEVLERLKAEDPGLASRMEAIERQTESFISENNHLESRAVVTIPVVFHVVYRTTAENISDAQLMSQLDVLNLDFRALNSDVSLTPSIFAGLVADAEIQFCLAQRDPSGNATTGIDRKYYNRTSWGTNDAVKMPSQGGVAPWDASKYLNIWVCNIGGGILGYAQFPGGSASTDGVVLDYRYTGNTGTATSPYDKGRTATHEIGHYFNLRHIWGDATCGNDLVADTPVHNTSNGGCPAYPHYSTCSGTPVEMTMNYMDYTYDACMYMFSQGQKARMQAVLAPGGARYSLISSNGCQAPGGGGETCAVPTSLNATGVTSSSATLNWAAVSGAASYYVQFRAVGSSTWVGGTVTSNSASATGLSPLTTYEFQVQANCSSGSSAFSATTTFTTSSSGGGGGSCTDTYEPNETRNAAKSIPVNTVISAAISTSSDKDYFKFNNTSSQRNIRIDLTSLPADYDVRLYRGASQVGISQNAGTADELIKYNNNQSATTYYVYVYGYGGVSNANDCYDLKASISSSAFRGEDGSTEAVATIEDVTEDFVMFPNPASTEIVLDIQLVTDAPTQISLFDATGKEVIKTSRELTKGDSMTTVDISQLAPGVYFVRVNNGQMTATRRLIINR